MTLPTATLAGSRRAALLRFVDALPRTVPEVASWLPASIAIGLAPGVALFQLRLADRASLAGNHLDLFTRLRGSAMALGSLALMLVAMAVVQSRARAGSLPVAPALRRLDARLSPLLLLPIVAWLSIPGVEATNPAFVLLLLVASGAVAAVFTLALPEKVHHLRAPPWLAPSVLGVAMVAYAVGLSLLALRHHSALGTGLYDLGIYDNVVWNSSRGHPLATTLLDSGTHATSHFDPVLVLLAPLYWVKPGAPTLLVFQSVWLALGAVPLWLLCRHLTGRPLLALAVALAYLLHPAVHGANLYDFHSLTLSIPPMLAAFWLLETGRMRWFWANLALLLLVREDVALLMALLGAFLVLVRGQARRGALVVVVSLAWYVGLKLLVQRTGLLNDGIGDAHHSSYTNYYKDLIPASFEGTGGLVASVLSNPVFALSLAFTAEKALYLALMFVPMLGLPLLVRGRLMLALGLVAILLASKPEMYSIHFQYVALLLPMGFYLLCKAFLAGPWRLDARRTTALGAALLVVALGAGARFGAVLPNDSFKAGFGALEHALSADQQARALWLDRQVEAIPRTDPVSATPRLLPHVTARNAVGLYPEPAGATWLLLETGEVPPGKRPDPAHYRKVGAEQGLEVWRLGPPL